MTNEVTKTAPTEAVTTHQIELQFGHADADGVTHKTVVFGKRLTGADLMSLDHNPQAQSETQYDDLVRRSAMTKFGALRMPPALTVLLGLNKIDRTDLATAYETFVRESRGERTVQFGSNTVRLYWGFLVDGVRYPIVEMGRLTTGTDEAEADALNLTGVSRLCFLIGRSITKISTEDEKPSTIEGPLSLAPFYTLDADDIHELQRGLWLAEISFRTAAKKADADDDAGETIDAIDTDDQPGEVKES